MTLRTFTDEEIAQMKKEIDNLGHGTMASLMRHAAAGHPYFRNDLPLHDYFQQRFRALGGMTPTLSKEIGWAILFCLFLSAQCFAADRSEILSGAVRPLPDALKPHTKENAVRDQIKQDVKDAIKEARAEKPAQAIIIVQQTQEPVHHYRYLPDSDPIPTTSDLPRHYSWESSWSEAGE